MIPVPLAAEEDERTARRNEKLVMLSAVEVMNPGADAMNVTIGLATFVFVMDSIAAGVENEGF